MRKRREELSKKYVENPKEAEKDLKRIKRNFEAIRKAKGILKNKKIDPIKYQKEIRAEWDERDKKIADAILKSSPKFAKYNSKDFK